MTFLPKGRDEMMSKDEMMSRDEMMSEDDKMLRKFTVNTKVMAQKGYMMAKDYKEQNDHLLEKSNKMSNDHIMHSGRKMSDDIMMPRDHLPDAILLENSHMMVRRPARHMVSSKITKHMKRYL